ncbi:ATP-dependent RNA helicase DHX8 [Zopfochytrium polystomum]|nr:ATP-dependent RNA helicase DHX8 [Zopfochytrium polystomum]
MRPLREVRAVHDADTITVYQAYSHAIADAVLAAGGSFLSARDFNPHRMTWIKPSFHWMMYRCGHTISKDDRQRRVLAIRMRREGFCALLRSAVVLDSRSNAPPAAVRVQWDPERDPWIRRCAWRSIQVGVGRDVVRRWAEEWVVEVRDVTPLAVRLAEALRTVAPGDYEGLARAVPDLPVETPVELPDDVRALLGME